MYRVITYNDQWRKSQKSVLHFNKVFKGVSNAGFFLVLLLTCLIKFDSCRVENQLLANCCFWLIRDLLLMIPAKFWKRRCEPNFTRSCLLNLLEPPASRLRNIRISIGEFSISSSFGCKLELSRKSILKFQSRSKYDLLY